jgi:hypothetical protein
MREQINQKPGRRLAGEKVLHSSSPEGAERKVEDSATARRKVELSGSRSEAKDKARSSCPIEPDFFSILTASLMELRAPEWME